MGMTAQAPFVDGVRPCSKCGQPKRPEEFYKRRAVIGGLKSECKACTHDYRGLRYKNDEQYRQKCRDNSNAAYAKARLAMVAAYGGKCECCGESEPKFLSVDHVNGGGKKHRKQIGTGGKALCCFLRRNGYPKDGYALLCFNCNCTKGFFGECPHQTARHSLRLVASS